MRSKLLVLAFLLCATQSWAQGVVTVFPTSFPSPFTINSTNGVTLLQGQLLIPDGDTALPGLAFSGATGTGWLRSGASIYGSIAGTPYFRLTATSVGLPAASCYYFSSGSATASGDAFICRDAPNTTAQKNANADQFQRLYGANGGYWERGVNSELLTIAAAATTDTVGSLLPPDAIIESVVVRVTTVIPTAATFTVGDATTAARFATGVAVAANTTAVGILHRHPDVAAAAGPVQVTASKVRITPNASPGAATGVVRVEVFFSRFVAPTS